LLSNLPNNPTLFHWHSGMKAWRQSRRPPALGVLIDLLSSCVGTSAAHGHQLNLNQFFLNSRKGIVRAGPAVKIENAPNDDIGPVTLLGLIETTEGTAANAFLGGSITSTSILPGTRSDTV
jgi:hypothetical protein